MTHFSNEPLPYHKMKELDLESEKRLTEGSGPADECICRLLTPPDDRRGIGGTMRDSIKRAIRSMSGTVKKRHTMAGGGGTSDRERGGRDRGGSCVGPECDGSIGKGGGVFIPLTTVKGGKGIYTTKEAVKRTKPCGKCGCDKENIFLKHSYANIKIISPDVSSICPCPDTCLNSDAFNNIKVTVERTEIHHLDTTDSEASVSSEPPPGLPEPLIEQRPINELIDAQYECTDLNTLNTASVTEMQEDDDVSEWSFGIMVGEEEGEGEEEGGEEEMEEDPPVDQEPQKVKEIPSLETVSTVQD